MRQRPEPYLRSLGQDSLGHDTCKRSVIVFSQKSSESGFGSRKLTLMSATCPLAPSSAPLSGACARHTQGYNSNMITREAPMSRHHRGRILVTELFNHAAGGFRGGLAGPHGARANSQYRGYVWRHEESLSIMKCFMLGRLLFVTTEDPNG